MRDREDNPNEGGHWENPHNWPTHRGSEALWEELGRTIATFGMLEDILARACFAVTGEQQADEEGELEQRQRLQRWRTELIEGLTEPLKPLANRMAAAWKASDGGLNDMHVAMAAEIKELADERNLLCHGAWIAFEPPDRDRGTIRYFPRSFEVGDVYQATRSVQDLSEIRGRVTAIIEGLIADTKARTGRPFPGCR